MSNFSTPSFSRLGTHQKREQSFLPYDHEICLILCTRIKVLPFGERFQYRQEVFFDYLSPVPNNDFHSQLLLLQFFLAVQGIKPQD